VAERTATDPAAIVGDEAHIVARSSGGPRSELLDERMIDAYENLILLCKVHHKLVDDQQGEYTKEHLGKIKARHEEWVAQTLGQGNAHPGADLWSRAASIRLRPDPSFGPVKLTLLVSGRAVWEVIADAHSFSRDSLQDDSDREASDLADEFLDDATNWGEINREISDQVGIREAERQFTGWLDRLAQRGLVVYGGRRRLILEGGTGPPAYWWESIMQVVRISDLPGAEPPEE
jgi:HNH endonuclease